MAFRLRHALVLAFAALLTLTSAAAQAEVPAAVQAQLARGINLTFWFTWRGDSRIDPRLFAPDDSDLAMLRRIGFTHARVPFDRYNLVDRADPSKPNPARVAEYVAALQRVSAQGMLAVATLTADDSYLKVLLGSDAAQAQLSAFWWNLARQLAARLPPDKLVFEVLNEPGNDDAAASLQVMQTLVGTVRDAAPAYTIAVAGHKFSSVDEFLALKPLADSNIVYSFHFYEPMNFTHQGAGWGWPMWRQLHDLPYPSSEAQVESVLRATTPEAIPHSRYYGQQNWNRDKLAAILDKVAAWKSKYNVPVWCSEFGAYKPYAPPGARNTWLRDVHELLEARGIFWTHFDFAQHMGIVEGPQGARVWDREALAALGLKPPVP